MKFLLFYSGVLVGVAATCLGITLHHITDPRSNFWVAVSILAVMWLVVLGYHIGQQEGVRKGRVMLLEEQDVHRHDE